MHYELHLNKTASNAGYLACLIIKTGNTDCDRQLPRCNTGLDFCKIAF